MKRFQDFHGNCYYCFSPIGSNSKCPKCIDYLFSKKEDDFRYEMKIVRERFQKELVEDKFDTFDTTLNLIPQKEKRMKRLENNKKLSTRKPRRYNAWVKWKQRRK